MVEGVGIVFLRESGILEHINTINVFLLFSLNYSGEFFLRGRLWQIIMFILVRQARQKEP